MINVVQQNDLYQISFRYDPAVVDIVRSVPGRSYSPDTKSWTIHKDKLGFLIRAFRGTVYENQLVIRSAEDINKNDTLDSTTEIPDIDISKIPFYVKEGATPYKHQLDFMKYSIDRQQRGYKSGFLLADDQGLAKTCETMNLAIYNQKQYGFRHCLVICCINSSKYNWQEDIKEHTRGAYIPYILGTRMKTRGSGYVSTTSSADKYQDLKVCHMFGDTSMPDLPYFLVINIEAIRYRVGKTYPIADRLIELINSGYINMVAIDEIHKNASPSSMQGKQLLRIKSKTGSNAMWIPMTGTPITSKPTDVFLPLKLVDAHNFTSYYTWCKEFCVYGGYGDHEIVAYKNVPRLKVMLQKNMIRRLKSEVLDLPPKIRYTEYVENTSYQQRLYEDMCDQIEENRAEILTELNPLTAFLRLRQINGAPELVDPNLSIDSNYLKKNAKLQRLLELLADAAERGEKTIIFSNWVEVLRTLYRFVSKSYKTCCFTGTMKPELREKHKQVFIHNPEYTVMVGTIGAMGTSQTLTVARNVIFYDEPWTPSDKEQAEDRAYRIGTKDSVNIFTLMSKDTVDDRVHDILYTKEGISKFIVDGKIDIRNNPRLFDLLLGRESKSRRDLF